MTIPHYEDLQDMEHLCQQARHGDVAAIAPLTELVKQRPEWLEFLANLVPFTQSETVRRAAVDAMVTLCDRDDALAKEALVKLTTVCSQGYQDNLSYIPKQLIAFAHTQENRPYPYKKELHAALIGALEKNTIDGPLWYEGWETAHALDKDLLGDGVAELKKKYGRDTGGGKGRGMGERTDPRAKPGDSWADS